MKRTSFGLALLGLAFLVTNAHALPRCTPNTVEHDGIYSTFAAMKAACDANAATVDDHGSCPATQGQWYSTFGPSWAPYGHGYIHKSTITKQYSKSRPAPGCSMSGVYEHLHIYQYRYADTGCPDFRPYAWGDGTCQGTDEQPEPEPEPTPEPEVYPGTQVGFTGEGAQYIDNVVMYGADDGPGVPAYYDEASNTWRADIDAQDIVFDGVVGPDSHALTIDTRVNGESVERQMILRQKTLDANDQIRNTDTYVRKNPDGTHSPEPVRDEANGGDFVAYMIEAAGLKDALEIMSNNPILGGSTPQ